MGDRARQGVAQALQQQRAGALAGAPEDVEQVRADGPARPPRRYRSEGQAQPAGAIRFRCPLRECPLGHLTYTAWSSIQGVVRHINKVHIPAGQPMPTDFLSAFNLSLCERCQVMFFMLPQLPGASPADRVAECDDDEGHPTAVAGLSVTPLSTLTTPIPVMSHVPKCFRIQALSRSVLRPCDKPDSYERQSSCSGLVL